MFFKTKKLFGSKKQAEEAPRNPAQSWAVVLSKVLNPDVRGIVNSKICEIFDISAEEALNIIENAPIILLDDLTRQHAEMVKDYFRSTGTEMFLTNDPVSKSKCCRTVWPEPPALSFLREVTVQQSEQPAWETEQGKWQPKNEERPETRQKETETKITDSSFIYAKHTPKPEPEKEKQAIQGEGKSWKNEVDEIHFQINKILDESTDLKEDVAHTLEEIQSRESELSGQQDALDEIDKKNQMIQDDLSRFFHEFHEKFRTYTGKVENLESGQSKFGEGLGAVEEVKNLLHFSFYEYRKKFERLEKEHAQAEKDFEDKLREAGDRLSQWKRESEEMQKEFSAVQSLKAELKEFLESQNARFESLQGNFQEVRTSLEEKLKATQDEVQAWKDRAEAMSQKAEDVEMSKELLQETLRAQKEKFQKLEKEYRSLMETTASKKPEPASQPSEPDWKMREKKMAEKIELLERMQAQVIADLHERLKKESSWEYKADILNQSIHQLRAEQSELQKKILGKSRKKKGEASD